MKSNENRESISCSLNMNRYDRKSSNATTTRTTTLNDFPHVHPSSVLQIQYNNAYQPLYILRKSYHTITIRAWCGDDAKCETFSLNICTFYDGLASLTIAIFVRFAVAMYKCFCFSLVSSHCSALAIRPIFRWIFSSRISSVVSSSLAPFSCEIGGSALDEGGE